MIDKLTAGSMATAGVVIGFFIIQGWSGRNIKVRQYFGETPPSDSPEEYDDHIVREKYKQGTDVNDDGKQRSRGATIPFDVKAGTCPVGYQKEYEGYGDFSYPVCREIITN